MTKTCLPSGSRGPLRGCPSPTRVAPARSQ
ncbi:hypothetical protein E2C01_048025 [Portunus trituberculatus]|uniref:Uncharacterized protein n=1 Tax=Portunus trituberculatus TaxID=210409 RepID=A0A5B7G930_PORTR|nr:hypothetical protein [Portunus trituberculatus]